MRPTELACQSRIGEAGLSMEHTGCEQILKMAFVLSTSGEKGLLHAASRD